MKRPTDRFRNSSVNPELTHAYPPRLIKPILEPHSRSKEPDAGPRVGPNWETAVNMQLRYLALLPGFLLPISCGGDDPPEQKDASCTPGGVSTCTDGKVCEEVEGGEPACFAPLVLNGRVFDTTTDTGIEGARVVARDANDAAISPVAVTAADGSYSLNVPARRATDGSVVADDVTLRADAARYLTFPRAPRSAVPIHLAEATGASPAIQNALTEVGLIPLGESDGLGTVRGRVTSARPGGALVVVAGATGVADSDGDYAVFNVPAGAADVRGYLPGVNLESRAVDVPADGELAGVDLGKRSDATAVVSGNVQIVNAPGGSLTSVILVLEDTFSELTLRGETPPGLRAADVSGAFAIPNVPDGDYVALAAFENDALVRDPDTSIGGTEIVHLTVSGANVTLAEGFKVTGALGVMAPGAEGIDAVSGTPSFQWEDDSSEDSYTVTLFDALGTRVWEAEGVIGPKGNAPATVEYDGPALTPGMYYQFRSVSIKGGVPISSTEDLKGVFVYE